MFLILKQSELNNSEKRTIRARELIKETKLLNIARLAKMLIDLFGMDEQFKRVKEREGQEIEMHFPSLDGQITFILTSDRQKFDCQVRKAHNPVAKITLKVEEKDILKVLSKIIKSKDNIFGLLKIAKLYLLRKVKIKGSFGAVITLCRSMMIGKNRVYKKNN